MAREIAFALMRAGPGVAVIRSRDTFRNVCRLLDSPGPAKTGEVHGSGHSPLPSRPLDLFGRTVGRRHRVVGCLSNNVRETLPLSAGVNAASSTLTPALTRNGHERSPRAARIYPRRMRQSSWRVGETRNVVGRTGKGGATPYCRCPVRPARVTRCPHHQGSLPLCQVKSVVRSVVSQDPSGPEMRPRR